ncbi:hypothetical protein WR25_02900 [Diploscapter pachys]|uniref:Uncharacterized protein n=1 Tax=Diploscapter pachys TaxID=2018661 RepID=A0A2A2M5A0_9BILA|nr:hypothetical protein WR25_02900 [Diploscapter pachys]
MSPGRAPFQLADMHGALRQGGQGQAVERARYVVPGGTVGAGAGGELGVALVAQCQPVGGRNGPAERVDVYLEQQAIDRLAEDELDIALAMDDQFGAEPPLVVGACQVHSGRGAEGVHLAKSSL